MQVLTGKIDTHLTTVVQLRRSRCRLVCTFWALPSAPGPRNKLSSIHCGTKKVNKPLPVTVDAVVYRHVRGSRGPDDF